jgi:hypothetical protein
MAVNQQTCKDMLRAATHFLEHAKGGFGWFPPSLCDMSQGSMRTLVSVVDLVSVFKAVQGVTHPGEHATCQLLTASFLWKSIKKDVASWDDPPPDLATWPTLPRGHI